MSKLTFDRIKAATAAGAIESDASHGRAAAIAGITRGQLQYWIAKGRQLRSSGESEPEGWEGVVEFSKKVDDAHGNLEINTISLWKQAMETAVQHGNHRPMLDFVERHSALREDWAPPLSEKIEREATKRADHDAERVVRVLTEFLNPEDLEKVLEQLVESEE